MTYESTQVDIKPDDKTSLLHPYTSAMKWRKLSTAIKINGNEVTRYKAPFVTEYIDLSTGEIIKATDLRNDPRVPPQIYVGEIMLQRQVLMASLRKEVREFAFFTLQFRNNRRGITPGIDRIVEWYAHTHKKKASNVRRYVKALEEKGFLAGASLLHPLFQRTGKTVKVKDDLGEDIAATVKFLSLSMKN